jgi:MtfA peptidase
VGAGRHIGYEAMLLHWLREKKREKIRAAPFPERWLGVLESNVPHYRDLTAYEQEALRDDLRIFMEEKHWEACGGLELTDEIQVTIAAQACLLTLYLPNDYYPNVRSLLIYPAGYQASVEHVNPAGVVTIGVDRRLGEAWSDGPVVLSWQDALEGGTDPADGRNVVFHEFAHKLDMMDGRADGIPRLHEDAAYDRWYEAMKAEYDELIQVAEGEMSGVLDQYGAENAAELFAVATEAFFEKPRQLRKRHASLYAVLQEYYRQDPAARLDARRDRDDEE